MDKETTDYKFFSFLSMLYLAISLCSLVVAQKMCLIIGMTMIAGSLVYPLTFPLTDILTEIYGYKKTKTIVWFSFGLQILFALICLIIVNIQSPTTYLHSAAYTLVLGNLLRIALGSLVASALGTFLNIYIISKSKILLHGRLFSIRSLFSSLLGEFIYTIIAVSIMMYGSIPLSHLSNVIATSMLMKIIYNLITIVPASLTVIFLNKQLKIDNDETNLLCANITRLNTIFEVK
jgi:uncharacterized integral membrane protein (TIGR00697 family)